MDADKIRLEEFHRKIKPVRDNETYSVHDWKVLEDLVISMTVLHPGKETGGHSHKEAEEVYIFLEGEGEMQLGEEKFPVKEGDLVPIPKGEFHKVFNQGEGDFKFVCVFERYGERS